MKQLMDSPDAEEEVASATTDGPVADERELLGLGAADTLGFVVQRRRRATRAAAEEMAAVCHWADLHRCPPPAADDTDPDYGSISTETAAMLGHPFWGPTPRAWGGPEGVEATLRLSGEAAYLVTEFAVTEPAAVLQMPENAARHYLGESLECRDRLPRLWTRVMGGELEGWKGRRIARMTIPLNDQAAAFVDAALHRTAHKIGMVRIERVVEAAVLRCEPDQAAERAQRAAEKRGVWIDDELDGTSRVTAVTDSPDAAAFDQTLTDVAKALRTLGDDDPLEVRRAKALGILADPQYALDLQATAESTPATDPETGRRKRRVLRHPLGPQINLHLHTRLSHAATGSGSEPDVESVVRVDGTPSIGPRTLEAIQCWLTDLAPGAVVRLTPVIDTGADLAVDAYEIPTRIADQVEQRDLVCQFPWCGRQGRRHDKDHIEPYVDLDEGGPPRQTRAANLARLCRYHHRVKTFGGWHYHRQLDDSLIWTSPQHLTYRVDPTGTERLEGARPASQPRGSTVLTKRRC